MRLSLGEIIVDASNRYGDKVALIIENRSFTYRDLNNRSNQLANALVKQGIQPGDCVTLYGENSWEWVVSYYGILKIGAVVNPINVMLTPREVEYVVQDCNAKAIIASKTKGLPLLGIDQRTDINTLVLYGEDIPESAYAFNQLLEQADSDFDCVKAKPDSLSTICYTSGTTGNPKGAKLSHRAVVANTQLTALMHGRTNSDVVVTALPCPHVYGNVVMNGTFYTGGTLVLHSRFDAQAIFDSINTHQATVFDGVPTMYMYMLEQPNLSTVDFSHLRLCTVGGQTMPEAKMEAVEKAFNCPLIELWGMTELAGLGTTFAHNGVYKHGSIGVPLPYVRAKVVAVDDPSCTLDANEVGELLVGGPISMDGYYGNEDATAETLTHDGFVRTGDLARIDKDGFIFIVDRKKDLIITAGFNIYPAELERVIAEHPDVAMVAVGPQGDDRKGEIAKAYIVLKHNTEPTVDNVLEFCRERLAAYKVPRAIQFVADLPKTSSGKIMRRQLHTLDNTSATPSLSESP